MKQRFFLLIMMIASTCHATLDLTTNGQPQATIVVSPNASATERYAAEELQRMIQLISGATLPMQAEAEGNAIFIGTPDTLPKDKQRFQGENPEEIFIHADDTALVLAGATPRAALYATYTFLQEDLGARWFWPGEDGEYYPKNQNIQLSAMDRRHTPTLPYRLLTLTHVVQGYDLDTDIWMARNRMNVAPLNPYHPNPELMAERKGRGFLIRISGHNVKLPQETLKAHPEYAALYGGERLLGSVSKPPQLCWSNPEVQRLVSEEMEKWINLSPGVDIVEFYPADITHFCECEECVKMAPDVSTRWQKFSSVLIDHLKKTHPGKSYWTLAYQGYRPPPAGYVAPFENIGYCLYNGCYRHPFGDKCEGNREPLEEMKQWKQQGAMMGIRGYEFIIANTPMFFPLVSFLEDQIRYSQREGFNAWRSEIAPAGFPANSKQENRQWDTNRLSLYVVAQLMWNTDQTTDEILSDWMEHLYGPAAQAMKDYYLAMEKAWRSGSTHVTYCLLPPASLVDGFITESLSEQVNAYFTQARDALAEVQPPSVRERALAQVDLENRMFGQWDTLRKLRNDRISHYQKYAPRALKQPKLTAELDDPAWKGSTPFPAFEDVDGNPVADKTEAYALWDEKNLYLRFVCHDTDGENRVARFTKRDDAVWSDECVELFVAGLPEAPNGYGHLVFNAIGGIYDTLSQGGMTPDQGWNPEWSVHTSQIKDGWVADVVMPFKSFGIEPTPNKPVQISFKRTRRRTDKVLNSGWPDASYHNPHESGSVFLVEKEEKPFAVYAPNVTADPLIAELRKQHRVELIESEERLADILQQGCHGLVFRYTSILHGAKGKALWQQYLLPYLENGGRVMVVAAGDIAFENWLPEAGLNVRWSGRDPHPTRRTTSLDKGAWLMAPNDLTPIFGRGITPGGGYFPQGEGGWKSLAKMRLSSGEEVPFLLSTAIGKGKLFLTSSAFGFSGRHEIFGDSHAMNAVQLMENLFAR